MERPGLILLLAQLAALAAYATAGTAVLPLYRSKSPGLDPDSHRSSHNVVCEFPFYYCSEQQCVAAILQMNEMYWSLMCDECPSCPSTPSTGES